MSAAPSFLSHLNVTEIDAPDNSEAEEIRPVQISAEFIDIIKDELARSYLPITTFEGLYKTAGMDSVFEHLRDHNFPRSNKTLKGNFGEVLCQAYIKDATDFEIPYPKLRFRFAKTPSPHGEDVVAFLFQDDEPDILLLVEAKLRTGSVTTAIKQAHETVEMSINGQSECFLLNQVLAVLEGQGDADKCQRVNTMLTDYHGDKFDKVGGVFIVAPEKRWDDSHFAEHIEDNKIDPLWCWAFVVDDLKDLIKKTH